MRIESIDLIRYGHFSGQQIEIPSRDPDYYIIYGDNEAGKSTLLRGISALFFGVPVKTPDVHSCKGPELRIGATISNGAHRFSFRRRKGSAGTLLNPSEAQIDDDALTPFLRELDRERFDQFFALNHERLREGGEELLRGQGDVGSALFQAAGMLDLRRLLAKLDTEARELFSPKSRTRTISRILEDYKQAKSELRKLAISAATVKEKQAGLELAKEKLDRLKEESHSLQHELVRLRRIESNKPDLARLRDLRTTLAALEHFPTLPPDAGRQRDEAVAALANNQAQISALTQDIAQRGKRIHELPTNALLKLHEKEIEELNAATGAYLQSVEDRRKRVRQRDDALEHAQNTWKEIWPQPVNEAEKLRDAYSAKEEILQLVAEYKGVRAELVAAEEELGNITQEKQHLEEKLADHPELADPAGLVAAIEEAKSLGTTDEAGARLRSDIERLTRSAHREMSRLALWSGTLDQLESLKTPLLSTIEQYSREWERLESARRDMAVRHTSVLEAIRLKEAELASLASDIAGAGENELAAIRHHRDQLWALIKASAFDHTISPEEAARRAGITGQLADAFAGSLRKADQIGDIRFANARDAAIHDRLAKEIASVRAEEPEIKKAIEDMDREEEELRQRWGREWSELGATPLSPSEMKEWLQVRRAILDLVTQCREKQQELQSLEERAAQAAAQIRAKWLALDPGLALGDDSLPVLLRIAETFAKQRESHRRATEDLRHQLKSLSLERRRARLDECKQRLSAWSAKWTPHVHTLSLPETSTPDHVARALAVLEKVFHHLDEVNSLEYRIKRIGENIAAFDMRTAEVVAALDSSLGSVSADAAVKQLHSQLIELGNAETERRALQAQNERDKEMLAVCQDKVQQASATLERLKAIAGCTDQRELDAAIAGAAEKADKKDEYGRIAAGLIERNAVADLAQIEEEASAYDLDSLRSEIKTKEERLKNSVDEISSAAGQHGELTSEFERLENSEDSALQAQKAEDALAQLGPAVQQYLRLQLAFDVLQQAIESFREKHQGPILSRASTLFSQLTLGLHSGLTSDFSDDDKPVLVAIRRSGERVRVEGLSDGTRDQLYLALRLAAIEHHVKTVSPCPVVFDDLLINSDDTRATAALQIIGELARFTQVLFFTHHRRLINLGVKAGAKLVELGASASSAIA